MRWKREDGWAIDDDPAAVDVDRLHHWLDTDTYWWPSGLRRDVLERALANSLTLTALDTDGAMAGFGRIITDRATFAFWADVYVDPEHRGRGLGRWLTETFVSHPELASCRRLMLATRDAHGVYAAAGFAPLAMPGIFMEISRPLAGSRAAQP
jgi:GNAT superfamily N-acetyltransferase